MSQGGAAYFAGKGVDNKDQKVWCRVWMAFGEDTDWRRLLLLELSLVLTTFAVRYEMVSMADGIADSVPAIAPAYQIPVVLHTDHASTHYEYYKSMLTT
jgi:fructose/tagatose bisphosphate aldolase